MRRLHALVVAVLFAACSSPSTGTVTPPDNTVPRTLLAAQSVAASGGTLRYSHAGDALDGLTLAVPSDAYTAASQWTIVADSTITPVLPQGFSQVGPAIVVTNSLGYAAMPISLTVPMSIASSNAIAPFYYDPSTHTFEGIPLVDISATSATLATRHFSSDFLASRGPRQAALRTGAAFGNVVIIWARISKQDLAGTYATDFKPGRDDWEFANYGDYISPDGDCEGMSITALYYQYFVKVRGASYGLYHQYDSAIPNQWDNVQGIRFAGSVQKDYTDNFAAGVNQVATLVDAAVANHASLDALTSNWLVMTMKLTGNPVLMALRGAVGGHAVVAYAASSNGTHVDISFSDPNFPATVRTMAFDAGVLTPISLQLSATAAGSSFDHAYALGVTGEVPLSQIDTRYAEFKIAAAGKDRYPAVYTFAYQDVASGGYTPMGLTVRTSEGKFLPAVLCPLCPARFAGVTPDGRMGAVTYGQYGDTLLGGVNAGVQLARGSNHFVIAGYARSPYTTAVSSGFLDSREVTVIYTPPPVTIALSVGLGATVRNVFTTGETLQRGATLPLFATLKDSGNVVVGEPVVWTTSNATVASVDAAGGIVTGVAAGNALITATSSSVPALQASVTVTVTTPNNNPIASMVITPKTWSMHMGDTKQFTVTLKDAAGNQTTLSNGWQVGFAEDDSNLGSIVNTTGLFTADPTRSGTTTVRVFLVGVGAPNNIFDSAQVTITP